MIRLKLTRLRDGAVLLDDVGLHAGVEVMDEKRELAAGVFHAAAADD